jgi:hypothetical protein
MIGLVPLAAACGGGKPPTMQGREGMLSKTAIAQKCEEAAKGHDRPFVIEWDATDLASFEALAHRDTVVVKYAGCDIQVLDRCADASVSARLGAYGAPQFTSGTVQGFDIGNEGELYAKLPLGAASLSGKVSAGENLHLKYFVSGVSTTSRDALYSDDIAKIPGCAGATHFVWAYNLGAFELNSAAHNAEEAQAGFGNIGAGGSHGHQESSLANGGSMDSCSTNDQRSCRVPIRLVLRAITQGSDPAGASGQQMVNIGGTNMTVAQATQKNAFDNTPAGQAVKMIEEANHREQSGDGKGCVDLLDRAVNLDPSEADRIGRSHAVCQMKAGSCDIGKKEFRQYTMKNDPNRTKSDVQIDEEVKQVAKFNCPASFESDPGEFMRRTGTDVHDARQSKDGRRCQTLADGIQSKIKDLKPSDPGRSQGISAQGDAALCVAENNGCKAGYEIYKRNYRLQLPTMTQATVDRAATESWGTMQKLGQLKCQ